MAANDNQVSSNLDDIVFVDFASQDGKPFGITTMKTRLALNFKSLPYTTKFLTYPSIAPFLTSVPNPPAPQPSPPLPAPYTLPAARIAGTWTLDSLAIATALEATYPAPTHPSLRIDSPLISTVEPLILKMLTPLIPLYYPLVVRKLLPPKSAEYITERYGKSLGRLEDVEEKGRDERVREEWWGQAQLAGKELLELYGRNGEGMWLEGKEPGYADLIVLGTLWSVKRHSEEMWERMVGWDGEKWRGLWKEAERREWMGKED